MVPNVDYNKAATALGLLTSEYAGKPAITGVLTSLANRFQLLEQQIWSVINAYVLKNYPIAGQDFSVALDNLGAIIGEPRGGRNDATYVPALYLRILINRSRGRALDVIAVVQQVLTNFGLSTTLAKYWEPGAAAFEVDVIGISSGAIAALLAMLPQVRSAGTRGMLVSSSATPATTITFGSVGFGGGLSFASNRSV